ncbi:MAG: tRNA pseudouridine(55) synthase TruB [Clostridia bacterium]|nr:tRNA pseudouridine(55) synthase TruB [Clostridia bacterium]
MIEGILNILKPPGMTSSDVVADVRHILHMKRVGHMGTLDPGAAGVLGICLGRATRLFDLLVDKEKEYVCELALGKTTDTQDSYGAVLEVAPVTADEALLLSVLPRFTGEIEQTAPLYSAIKVDGKALYAHTRAGNAVESRSRRVQIYELSYLGSSEPDRYMLRIRCSKGTYIRTLCQDIGAAMGCPAHMSFLLRTAAGPLRVEDAVSLAELSDMAERGCAEAAVTPPDAALPFLPPLAPALSPKHRKFLLNGASIPTEAADGLLRLYVDDAFIGVGEAKDGMLHLSLSFLQGD